MEPGEILLTCQPLGPLLLHGEEQGQTPSVAELLKLMGSSRYTRSQIKWIELLRYTKLLDHHVDDLQDLMQVGGGMRDRDAGCVRA